MVGQDLSRGSLTPITLTGTCMSSLKKRLFIFFDYFNFILLHMDIQFSQHHLLKRLSFPHEWFWHLCQNSTDCIFKGLPWVLYSILLMVYMSTFMPLSHCFDYYSFAVILKSRSVSPLSLVFFFRIILAIQGPYEF